jgi:predicted metal-dependent hydrolase
MDGAVRDFVGGAAVRFDDERIQQGIQLFNDREYFACHDVFEDYWTELVCPERTFFQGVIQAAVALFHFEEGNLGGALRMYRSATAYLSPWAPEFDGFDVERLLRGMEICFAELDQPHQSYPSHVRFNSALVPELQRTATGGNEIS